LTSGFVVMLTKYVSPFEIIVLDDM
ncbi:MAG: hypothetical protein ACJA2S_005826, partial [Cyclobacteriaceae bacterium]